MAEYEITRDGQPALAFDGELLAELTSKGHQGDAQNRWHEVELYEVEECGFVAAVCYHSLWQGESGLHCSFDCATKEALLGELRGYDPTLGVDGRPERSDAERERNGPFNQRVRDGLRRRWEGLLTEAADKLGVIERLGRPREGRPNELGASTQVAVRIPDSDLAQIDRLRGEASRSDWIRETLRARLASLGVALGLTAGDR